MSKFKVGDRVVMHLDINQQPLDVPVYGVVVEIMAQSLRVRWDDRLPKDITNQESNHYAFRFEHADVYGSPLYKALL